MVIFEKYSDNIGELCMILHNSKFPIPKPVASKFEPSKLINGDMFYYYGTIRCEDGRLHLNDSHQGTLKEELATNCALCRSSKCNFYIYF